MRTELNIKYTGSDMVAGLTEADYAYAPENVPEIRVMGTSAFWDVGLEDSITEDDAVLLQGNQEDHEAEGTPNEGSMDQCEAFEAMEDQVGGSPLK
ncbi:hypothetical protein QFC19_008608 [Naganishia cerealis]|uniref:Uncharacterized protein n=1 Tax=Naganishia cerealis TaxID=610337 RepID=A0ACC2V089_9TREE|nr:hypothetical protein QFC19_008608 [Naganishia cerealis]